MSTAPDRDRHLDELLRRAVPASSAVTPACPDAEVLAAWADGGLDALARETAEGHVAGCARCQAVVAMLVTSEPAPVPAAAPWWRAAMVRWLAPAALVTAAATVWILLPGSGVLAPPHDASREARVETAAAAPPAAQPPAPAPLDAPSSGTFEAAPVAPPGRGSLTFAAPQAPQERAMRAQAEAEGGAGAARIEPPAAVAATPPATAAYAPAPPPTRAVPAAPAVATPVTSMAAEVRAERVAETVAAVESPAGQNRAAAADATVPSPAAAAPARPALRDSAKMSASAEAPAAPEARMRQSAEAPGVTGALARAVLDIASPGGRERWRVRGTVIEHTLDAGATWSTTANIPGIALTVGASPAGGVCWLAGRDGAVLRTTDGVRWVRVSSPLVADVVNLDARDARTATIVTRDGRRFSTADGGATWVSP